MKLGILIVAGVLMLAFVALIVWTATAETKTERHDWRMGDWAGLVCLALLLTLSGCATAPANGYQDVPWSQESPTQPWGIYQPPF